MRNALAKTDHRQTSLVLDRVLKEGLTYSDRLSMLMDLEVACEQFNLDLKELLSFNRFNFAHDILGIAGHINRRTKHIENCFLPRCAKGVENDR